MGNLSKKANFLLSELNRAGALTKKALQKITHKDLDASQPAIGNEMQKETQSGTLGDYVSDKSVDAEIKGVVEPAPEKLKVEGSDDAPAEGVMKSTGATITKQDPSGNAQGLPADVVKSAALMTRLESAVRAHAEKEQAIQKQAALEEAAKKEAEANEIVTATQVMNKIASLAKAESQEDIDAITKDIACDYEKLANGNPLFNIACERRMMAKMAAEIDALAASEGISPEEAASALDAATAADPAAAEELNNEVEGEALSDLAAAEEEQAGLMDGLEQTAAQVSEMTGQEVTSDDIIAAVEEVVDQAEQMGVEPEVLIQAAAEEMMGGAGEEPSEEDMAQAEQLVQEAAANGVSPEELLQGLAGEVGGGDAGTQEAPATELPAPEAAPEAAPSEGSCEKECDDEEECEKCEDKLEDMEKEACLKKLASTRRGANLYKILTKQV